MGRPRGSSTSIPITPRGNAQPGVTGIVGDLGPIVVERVDGPDAQRLFRELVGRYHSLGYRVPFGAQLRYLVYASTPTRTVVACLQIVNRKVSGGNRSERGAETQEILSSIVQTARLRALDPRDVLVELLRSPQPTVSPALSTLL